LIVCPEQSDIFAAGFLDFVCWALAGSAKANPPRIATDKPFVVSLNGLVVNLRGMDADFPTPICFGTADRNSKITALMQFMISPLVRTSGTTYKREGK